MLLQHEGKAPTAGVLLPVHRRLRVECMFAPSCLGGKPRNVAPVYVNVSGKMVKRGGHQAFEQHETRKWKALSPLLTCQRNCLPLGSMYVTKIV